MTTPRCEGQNFGELDQVAHGMHPLNGQLPGMGKLFWKIIRNQNSPIDFQMMGITDGKSCLKTRIPQDVTNQSRKKKHGMAVESLISPFLVSIRPCHALFLIIYKML